MADTVMTVSRLGESPNGPEHDLHGLVIWVKRTNPGPEGPGFGTEISASATQDQRSTSPRMKASTEARPSSSGRCTGGDFIRYDDAESSGPPMPRSLAIFAARMASMMMPAEFGESQTS